MRCKLAVSLVSILAYFAITQTATAASQLTLVAAQSLNAPATFTSTEAVTFDGNYIYAASGEGVLYIKSRNTSGFPLVKKIQVGLEPLRSVRVDGNCHTVYVTGNSTGDLYKFSNLRPFAPQGAMPYSPYGLEQLSVDSCTSTNPGSAFISVDESFTAVNGSYVYFSSIAADGRFVDRIDKATGTVTMQYGVSTIDPTKTYQFYRSGALKGTITNPPDVFGSVHQANLYVNAGILALYDPGCCGTGVYLYNAGTLTQYGTSKGIEMWVDSVSIQTRTTSAGTRKLMVLGRENGVVSVWDVTNPANVTTTMSPVATINLPVVTGFTCSECIEIRSVAARFDVSGNLWIYAVSSGGDSVTMTTAFRTKLPKFFVLELK